MQSPIADDAAPARLGDVVVYLVGVVGLAASVTMVFLAMRAVMDVGGACADGGAYQIQTRCPDGIGLLMTLAFPALFLFGGLMVWRGARFPGRSRAWSCSPGPRCS